VRENRTHGSEGGEAKAFPTPIVAGQQHLGILSRLAERRGKIVVKPLAFLMLLHVDRRDKPSHDGAD
jgi:hypothetical protein